MKKYILKESCFLCAFAAMIILGSCNSKPQESVVRIDEMTDSTITVSNGSESGEFSLVGAVLTNGAVMVTDSVKIVFTGSFGSKSSKLQSIQLIDRPSKVIELKEDTTRELLTVPVEPAMKQ